MMRAPSLSATVARIARLACPACGRGALFRRFFRRAETCSCCGWTFERGEGHWVGGSEVHMFASYGLSVLFCVPIVVFAGTTPVALGAVVATHVVVSLVVFRYSRAVFLGLDYYFDPAPPPGKDDDDGRASPVRPRTPPLLARRRARRRERASERAREPVRSS